MHNCKSSQTPRELQHDKIALGQLRFTTPPQTSGALAGSCSQAFSGSRSIPKLKLYFCCQQLRSFERLTLRSVLLTDIQSCRVLVTVPSLSAFRTSVAALALCEKAHKRLFALAMKVAPAANRNPGYGGLAGMPPPALL